MAEELQISSFLSKEQKYVDLIPQLQSLIANEPSLVANLANVAAALKQTFGFFWVGFYLVEERELVLGPFQGTIACTRIGFGKGVCGAAWQKSETIVVTNVDAFPGHIACSTNSKSEIVVPILLDGQVVAILDVDSDQLDDFNHFDVVGLENICQILKPLFK